LDSDSYLCLVADFLGGFSVTAPSPSAMCAVILAGLLLLVSAFASASETAFFSLSPSELASVAERKHASDARIAKLLDDTERLLATLLITNNVANVAVILLCNFFFVDVFHFFIPAAQFGVLMVVLCVLILLLGEIIPKMFSAQKALAFCRFASPGVEVCRSVFYPFASLMVRCSSLMDKWLMRRKGRTGLSVDELSHALELTDKTELKEENNLLEGIIRFGEETAKEIMTSRLDMVDLEIRTPFKDVLKCIVENVYSRIPVYSETRDNIKGILYIKDLLPHLSKGDGFRWQSLIRPAYFVPETKMIDELLRDFQANKIHIAIVVDEFGGTSGLVTMEDIIEEIVGEIRDEYDDEERTYARLDEHTWVFEAKTQLIDFYKITKIEEGTFDEVAGDADTLAGLVLELKGEFPARHEKLTWDRYEFEVLELDNRRILKVKFTICESPVTLADEDKSE